MGYPPANTFPPFAVWHSAQYPPPASASPFTINSGAKVWGADARMGAIAGRHASAKKPTTLAPPSAKKQISSFLNEDILETASCGRTGLSAVRFRRLITMHQMVQRMKPDKNRQIFLKQRGSFSA